MILPYVEQLLYRVEAAICGPFGPLQPIIRCSFDNTQLAIFSKSYDLELKAEFTNLQAQAITSDINNFIIDKLIESNKANFFYGSLGPIKANNKDIFNYSTNKNCALKFVLINDKYRFIQEKVSNTYLLKLPKHEMIIIDNISGNLQVALEVKKSLDKVQIKFGFIPSKIRCNNIDVVLKP